MALHCKGLLVLVKNTSNSKEFPCEFQCSEEGKIIRADFSGISIFGADDLTDRLRALEVEILKSLLAAKLTMYKRKH